MGSIISRNESSSAVTNLINFDDDDADGTEQDKNVKKCVLSEECQWFEKIQSVDDEHSAKYHLCMDELETYIANFESRLKKGILPTPNIKKYLIRCYRENKKCPGNCKREYREYIDCLDTMRLEKIRAKAEKAIIEKRKNKTKAMVKIK